MRPDHPDGPVTSHGPHAHARRPVAEHAAAVARLVVPARLTVPERVTLAELLAHAREAATLPPRALAGDAVAVVPIPGFDNSQMDGYAVRAADLATAAPGAPVVLPAGEPGPAGTVP